MVEILTTTDGSERSLRVVPHGIRLARAAGVPFRLLSVLEPRRGAKDAAAEATEASLRAALEASPDTTDVECGVVVVEPQSGETPVDVLLREASERDSVIVMATRGAGIVRRTLLGGVAATVLARTRRPIVLVGPRVPSPDPAAPGRYRALAPLDGGHESAEVLPALARVFASAPPHAAAVVLLRVLPTGGARPHPSVDDCRVELEAVRAHLPASLQCDTVVREVHALSSIDVAITEAAADLAADSIWIATHAQSPTHHLRSGSIAVEVLGRGAHPVVFVPIERR